MILAPPSGRRPGAAAPPLPPPSLRHCPTPRTPHPTPHPLTPHTHTPHPTPHTPHPTPHTPHPTPHTTHPTARTPGPPNSAKFRGVAEVAKIVATICHNLGQFLKCLLFSISTKSD